MIKFTKLALGAAGVLMGVSLGELQQGGALVWTHNGKAPVFYCNNCSVVQSSGSTATWHALLLLHNCGLWASLEGALDQGEER
eukprot:1152100-Pelagomonas_calceolata.AAC.2